MTRKLPPSRSARYHDLFDRMLDSAFLVDAETLEVLESNSSAERTFLATQDELQGKTVLRWIDPVHVEEFQRAVRVAQRRFHPRQFDCHWVDVDGNALTMQTLMCMLKLDDGREVLQIIAVDVTEDRHNRQRIATYLSELETLAEQLKQLSVTDEMTGLPNFRRFREEAYKEHMRAIRYSTPYAVVFLDADHFKLYNDREGHPAGDRLLRQLADILQEQARETDLAARYGGEEFVILCPAVDTAAALVLAERVRVAVEAFAFTHAEEQPGGKFTVSIGVASFPENGEDLEQVIEAADKALYESKRAGRNRCTAAASPKKGVRRAG